MATFTLDDLQAALGDKFKLERFGDDQANVVYDGGGIGFIGLEDNLIESEIAVTGYSQGESVDEDKAREIMAELKGQYESAGFSVSGSGSISEHWYQKDPDAKYPHIEFEVTQKFDSLDDAVRILKWLSDNEHQLMR